MIDTLFNVLQHAPAAHGGAAAAPHVDPWLVWMVPLLPVFGFLFQLFVGRKMPKPIVSLVSCGVVLASCAISWYLFSVVRSTGQPIVAKVGEWILVPGLSGALSVVADHRLVVDQLTCVMILVITNIGFLIHVYSTGYMAEEKRYARYFSYLNLFTGFMLILVMGANLLLMFVGWEGVGLCSYLLIGFWFEKKENAIAGMKAFIVNRVGDLAFTIGALTLFVTLGNLVDPSTGKYVGRWTVDFAQMKEVVAANKDLILTQSGGLMTFVGIMLFIGATGKSAQIPLYVWLPDAMAGPTPVSALIHAATMVTAGVYMIARMSFLYALTPAAMAVVATVGAVTGLTMGLLGFAQNDIKKVLAYSTVSQLGFMFMGVGSGAFAAGVFHLFTHAFFKACLFLGSGSVIHGMGGEQDIRKMGGLKSKMPITFWTFAIASAALAGVPGLAGFFSKDEILWKLWDSAILNQAVGFPLGKILWALGAAAAGCTAFYMTRLVIKTFLDRPKWAVATSFSGGGKDLPDWMDEPDKKKDDKPKPKDGASKDGFPSWMDDEDESLLDMSAVGKPPKAPPPPHEDHAHAADLPQDESLLDLPKRGGKKDEETRVPAPAAAAAQDAHAHDAAPPHDHDEHAHAQGHDAAPGDADHGHGGGHGHGAHGEPHESPFSMWVALALLAAGSVLVGYLNVAPALGGSELFSTWLAPVVDPDAAKHVSHGKNDGHAHHHDPMEYVLMGVSIVAAFGGIFLGWYVYGKRKGVPAQDFAEKHRELYEFVRDKYRVDEFYQATVIDGLLSANEAAGRFDNEVVDASVNGAARATSTAAKGAGLFDNEVVDAAVNGMAMATQSAGRKVRRLQTGNIRDYLTFALVGGLFVIAFFCLILTWPGLGSSIGGWFRQIFRG